MELSWTRPATYPLAISQIARVDQVDHQIVPLPNIQAGKLHVWYSSDGSSSTNDPARSAYEEAVALFTRELTQDECKRIWLRDKSSMYDVQQAIRKARDEYEGENKKSKVRTWLTRCAVRIVHYGNIMDVLVQGCPDYASFIWGGLKFLFVTLVNHEELLLEISKSISRIASVLPRAELLSILYPTDRMKTALSELYAKIIEFVQSAIKYYKSSSLSKSITAIIKPFALSFKLVLEDITEASRAVDELANSALKAEIRDLHIQVKRLTEITLATQSLQTQMSQSLAHQMHHYETGQLEMIQSLPLIEAISPRPNETLQLCRSMKQRRRVRMPSTLSARDMNAFKAWLTGSGISVRDVGTSSILIAEAHGVKTSARDFAVDLIDLTLKSDIPAIWVLPGEQSNSITALDEFPLSFETLLASLVTQALALNPTVLSAAPTSLSLKNFKSGLPPEQWFRLFQRSIHGLPFLLIVLDLPTIQSALHRSADYNQLIELDVFLGNLESISKATDGTMKIVVLTWKLDDTAAIFTRNDRNTYYEESSFVETQRIATDPGPQKVRMMRNPKFRAVYSARRQKIALALRDAT